MLLAVNPSMPTIRKDWQLFGKTAEAYSVAAQDILSTLDAFSTTSVTITEQQKALNDAAAGCDRLLQRGDQHDRPQ